MVASDVAELRTLDRLGLAVASTRMPTGCKQYGQTGYRGRVLLAELLLPERGSAGKAILARAEAGAIERRAVESGMVTRWQRAVEMVEAGVTGAAEVRRVMGFGMRGAKDILAAARTRLARNDGHLVGGSQSEYA